MYAALWRALPGPRLAKAAQCLVLALLILAVCFLWLFPWIAPHMPFNDATVGSAAGAVGVMWPPGADGGVGRSRP